jgi:glycyl-tRNA synthetase
VIPSFDRLFLALMVSAYREEEVEGEKRVVLGLHPALAPVKVSVLPLVKNKPEIVSLARDIYKKFQTKFNCEYDTSGAIGRRYRRADEAGTPFCVTIDYESPQDDCVTIRERDSMEQNRIKISDVYRYVSGAIEGTDIW